MLLIELNKIYNEDCLEFMRKLPSEYIDLIIADPPYFGVVKDEWDNQWKNDYSKFKDWIDKIIIEFERILKVNGSVYFYGWFTNMLPLYEVINNHFFIRQNITIHKGVKSIAGRTSSKLKMFPTATEYIWVLTKQDTVGRLKNGNSIIDPIHNCLQEGVKPFKLKMKDINKLWGHPENSGIAGHYFRDKSQPAFITEEKYNQLINHGCKFKYTYNQLKEMYESKRIKFNLPQGVTDVWEIDFYKDDKWGHSTQKPMQLCDRIVDASSNEGDLIYIPFAGSGSEIISCINKKRNYIATETKIDYIDKIIVPRIKKECNKEIEVVS